MFSSTKDNDFRFDIAEFEDTAPALPPSQQPRSPAQGGTTPLATVTVTAGPAPAPIPDPVDIDVSSPVLTHIAEIASEAEKTVASLAHDMNMSTVAYFTYRNNHDSLQSIIDLGHLSNLFVHVFKYSISKTRKGYLEDVALDRLESVCNSASYLHQSVTAVAIKAHLFARCSKRRLKYWKDEMVKLLVGLQNSVQRFVWTIETRLGRKLVGWKEVLELIEFAREAWKEVVT